MDKNENNLTVPYIVYEGEMARNERHIKRLVIALIVAIALIFASNAAWLFAWCQYDYNSQETVVELDGTDGGNANYIGNDGDIINGTGEGYKAHSDTDAQGQQGNKNEEAEMKHTFNLSRSEISALIDEWILSERNRAILKRRLLDGICFEPLAEEFSMSVTQIKTIVYKSQDVVFKHYKPREEKL